MDGKQFLGIYLHFQLQLETTYRINETVVKTHVGDPFWPLPQLCIAYDPPGPTVKSDKGVRTWISYLSKA